jgi:hypothetical protein
MLKRSRKPSAILAHLLLLVGDVLAFAGLAHAIALDGLAQDHRRLAGVVHRGMRCRRRTPCAGRGRRGSGARCRRRSCWRPSPSARDTCRRSARAHRRRPWPCSSGTRRRRPLPCAATQQALLVRASSASQPLPQITLMTFQPAPRKIASSSWMILPLPRTGPSRRCRLQLMTNTRLSSFSRAGQANRAQRLRLVHLAVAHEGPHLAPLRGWTGRGSPGTS